MHWEAAAAEHTSKMAEAEEPDETINLDKVCRTCLAEAEDLRSVFLKDETDKTCVSSMVSFCTQLKVTEGDGLPRHICCKCIKSASEAFSFKLQAEKADTHIRNYIAKKHLNYPAIKEEVCLPENPEIIIKTEIKPIEFFDDGQIDDNSYELPIDNDIINHSDDSDDNIKPLKDFKNSSNINKSPPPLMEISKKRNRKIVPCEFCNKTFLNSINLESHKQKCHSGYVQCDVCSRAFTKLTYLERHKTASHSNISANTINITNNHNNQLESNQLSCKLCHYTFAGEEQLISHISLSHNGPRKRGRPSKKDITMNKLRLQNLLETMNINNEVNNIDHPVPFLDHISNDGTEIRDGNLEISAEPKTCDNYCITCNKSFCSYVLYEKHVKKHIAQKILICKICDKTFKYNTCLKKHLQTHNTVESFSTIDVRSKLPLVENHVNIIGKKEDEITDQLIAETLIEDIKSGKIEGYIAEMKTDVDHDVYSDMNSDNEGNVDPSMLINKQKMKQEVLKLRKFKVHNCALCKQTFSKTNHLMRHMSTHNFEYPDKCEDCNKVFPNNEFLLKHKRTKCEHITKAYQCGTCEMKFTYEMSLNKHILRNHKGQSVSVNFIDPAYQKKEKSFVCQNCNKGFYRQEHLDRHVKIHMPSENKFECPICQRKFNRKDNLRSHSRVHEPNKEDLDSNCLCAYCGRSFSNSSNLIVHMRRHTGEKPYKCDICGKGFPRSSDLQCHRRTHTGEKPCLCTICGKGFSRSNKLVRHMRIHNGLRPYKCYYCDKAFTQSNDLTLHIRRHTGDKPYVCTVCGDRFIQGTALQNHKRIHGHEGPSQLTTPAANSVNNPNRGTVDKIGRIAAVKFETSVSSANLDRENISNNSSTENKSPSGETIRTVTTGGADIANFIQSSLIPIQNIDVPAAIPFITLSQYNQGFN